MEHGLFSAADREHLQARGLTEETALSQIATFKRGIPFTTLQRPCTVGDGIAVFPPDERERLATVYAEAALSGRATKFVPSSGEASRMFQLLLSALNRYAQIDEQHLAAANDSESQALLRCLHGLKQFAFYDDLKAAMARAGLDVETLTAHGQYTHALDYLLTPKGLGYAKLPKALLKFHRYADHCRTPLEEHLVEAAAYTQDRQRVARVHFTVAPTHQEAVGRYLAAVRRRYEQSGVHYEVTFSTQHPSTDTLAVDLENRPFRDQQGRLVFRPAGHGALLANLQALAADIVFVKNVDNVAPDHLKAETHAYKRALGGHLVEVQDQIFAYLHRLTGQAVDEPLLAQVFGFARDALSIVPPPSLKRRSRRAKVQYLVSILNRPLRVCGMVQNAGEPYRLSRSPRWICRPPNSGPLWRRPHTSTR
jgi:hypothetical protein